MHAEGCPAVSEVNCDGGRVVGSIVVMAGGAVWQSSGALSRSTSREPGTFYSLYADELFTESNRCAQRDT